MRRALALAVAAVLCCAACSATAAQTPPSATTAPPTTAPRTTSAPAPSSTPRVAAPTTAAPPAVPAVPGDVPRTGPNTRPGETPPVMPMLATQHSAAGARAFAEFFIKTIDWGYATTSSTYMRHYFEPTCIQCRNVELFLNTARSKGDHYLGGRIAVVDAVTKPLAPPARDVAEVSMHVNISSSEVLNRSGRVKGEDVAYNSLSEVAQLKWNPNGWKVVDLDSRT